MAKLSRDDRKTARAAANEETLRVRRRYAEALALGYSTADAATLAHGAGEIVAPNAPAPVEREEKPPATPRVALKSEAPPATVSLSGRTAPDEAPALPDIPPNWEDLPWPQLKLLAESLNGGRDVKSRKLAGEIITKALSPPQ